MLILNWLYYSDRHTTDGEVVVMCSHAHTCVCANTRHVFAKTQIE